MIEAEGFRFVANKGRYTWRNEFCKVVFSKASCTGIDPHTRIDDAMDMFNLNYTLDVYMREDNDWNHSIACDVEDFPALYKLKGMLEWALNNNKYSDSARKHEPGSEYTHYMSIESVGKYNFDDYYSITQNRKIADEHNRLATRIYEIKGDRVKELPLSENFDIFIGDGTKDDKNILQGVQLLSVTREDLFQLYTCINTLMRDLIDTHNKKLIKQFKQFNTAVYIENETLYESVIDSDWQLENFYKQGDNISALVYTGNLDGEYKIQEYSNLIIDKITDTQLVCSGKDLNIGNAITNVTLDLDKIIDMSLLIEESRTVLKERQIMKSFTNLLSEEELQEFKYKPTQYLVLRWNKVLLNYYYMRLDDHHFKKYLENPIDNANMIAKGLVKEIQSHIRSKRAYRDI